jgi:AMP phosphorylase
LAGKLLELAGKADKGTGYKIAEDTLMGGKAMAKFREIIELQGGNPKVKVSDLHFGAYSHTIKSKVSGSIFHVDNKIIAKIARIAGAPKCKGAGVRLHKVRGDRIEVGDDLYTIYSDSETTLDYTLKAIEDLEPIEMRKMLLGSVQ